MAKPTPVHRPRPRVFYGWWVLIAASLGAFCVTGAGPFTLTTLVKPMTEDFQWSQTELFGALTAAGFLSAFLAPLLGRFVDRHGTRIVITLGLVYLGFSLIATSYVQALWHFYLLYGLGLGVAQSAVWQVGASTAAANWFIRKRGIAYAAIAIAMSGIPFALVSQAILDQSDWRWVWRIIGLGVLAVPAPMAWLLIRGRPEEMSLLPDGDSSPAEVGSGTASAQAERTEVSWTLREAAGTRSFWLLNGSLLLTFFPAVSIIALMHPYFTDLGFASSTAAGVINFYGVSSIIGSIFWGVLIQRLSVRSARVPFAIIYGLAITLFMLVEEFPSTVALYLVVLPLGIAVMGLAVVGTQIWADYYGRKAVGSILGTHVLIRSMPIALGPLFVAAIHDTTDSYRLAFIVFMVLCFVAAVGLFFATPPRKVIPTDGRPAT